MRRRILFVGLLVLGLLQAGRSQADAPQRLCAIQGDIVSEDGAMPGWVVYDRDTGVITEICRRRADVPLSADTIMHGGYIFPGLIDTHNHSHYASVPMWRSERFFNNRYEWQQDAGYQNAVLVPYGGMVDAGLWYESAKYGEIRALIGGTTMIQGTDDADSGYLVRNLNLFDWGAYSHVTDITEITAYDAALLMWYMDVGIITRVFQHLSEGKRNDPRTQAEFPYLQSLGLAIPGIVVIHGVALTRTDFDVMRENGMYLVWSPKSNLVLYDETVDIVAALEAGVTVALGPDWTITGSDNLLEELKFAHWYSVTHLNGAVTPRQLFKMATSDAARVAGVDDPSMGGLGSIEVGHQADLILAPRFSPDPYVSLLKTYPQDINMVVVGGQPVCGQPTILRRWLEPAELDQIMVRNKKKNVDIVDPALGAFGEQRYDDLVGLLREAMGTVAPLIEDEPSSHIRFRRSVP